MPYRSSIPTSFLHDLGCRNHGSGTHRILCMICASCSGKSRSHCRKRRWAMCWERCTRRFRRCLARAALSLSLSMTRRGNGRTSTRFSGSRPCSMPFRSKWPPGIVDAIMRSISADRTLAIGSGRPARGSSRRGRVDKVIKSLSWREKIAY